MTDVGVELATKRVPFKNSTARTTLSDRNNPS